ncbi:putative 1-phosphatidylinositol-3-phosphate 5-kinase FAB1D [Abeliophyllum distichum]|uniref:1-phosphatidylinositol-3-phosphate 5-kinase FAB1D n=1 Tax=Abeliophyllum distichum TaxID=126358 RepID=A0ABD1PR44_9LAMI
MQSHFLQLRDRCCPSEVDYIASLSRCRNWDAKGGKSKSFFAKTLDNRFIIKEIKRTEFDSFMKFEIKWFTFSSSLNASALMSILILIVHVERIKVGRRDVGELVTGSDALEDAAASHHAPLLEVAATQPLRTAAIHATKTVGTSV